MAAPSDILLQWLTRYNLAEHWDLLLEQGFDDLQSTLEITEQDLKDIGINKVGIRRKFLTAIRETKEQTAGLSIHPDKILRLQYEDTFATGIKVFGDSFTSSSEPSQSVINKFSLLKSRTGCVACGWKGDLSTRRTILHEELTVLYPHHGAEVSRAHLVRSKEGCTALGVKFNEPSNFLALCGNRGCRPSCHDAFDHHKLCFVFQPQCGLWKMYAATDTAYDFLNREPLVDLSAYSPHPHVLHSHAITCFVLNQIKPVVGLSLEDVPRYEEIDPSLDPVLDLGSSD